MILRLFCRICKKFGGLRNLEYASGASAMQSRTSVGMKLVITDILGVKLFEQQMTTNSGRVIWNSGTLSSGVYLFTVSNNNGFLDNGKIVLVK